MLLKIDSVSFFARQNKVGNYAVVGHDAELESDHILPKYNASINAEYLHTSKGGVNRSDGLKK